MLVRTKSLTVVIVTVYLVMMKLGTQGQSGFHVVADILEAQSRASQWRRAQTHPLHTRSRPSQLEARGDETSLASEHVASPSAANS